MTKIEDEMKGESNWEIGDIRWVRLAPLTHRESWACCEFGYIHVEKGDPSVGWIITRAGVVHGIEFVDAASAMTEAIDLIRETARTAITTAETRLEESKTRAKAVGA
jgi:hypothetical protein